MGVESIGVEISEDSPGVNGFGVGEVTVGEIVEYKDPTARTAG